LFEGDIKKVSMNGRTLTCLQKLDDLVSNSRFVIYRKSKVENTFDLRLELLPNPAKFSWSRGMGHYFETLILRLWLKMAKAATVTEMVQLGTVHKSTIPKPING
jgi:hypothetical protein